MGPDGLDAIWFLSLEAGSAAAVALARVACGVPYRWADMAVDIGADRRLDYRSRRRRPQPPVGHDIGVVPGPPIPDDELSDFDWFLTARWRAGPRSLAGGPTWWSSTRRGRCPTGEPLVHYSPGVTVRLGIRFPGPARRS